MYVNYLLKVMGCEIHRPPTPQRLPNLLKKFSGLLIKLMYLNRKQEDIHNMLIKLMYLNRKQEDIHNMLITINVPEQKTGRYT